MNILTTIIPIFSIILLGWVAHRRGFIPDTFISPANRLVYYLAIPALIFRSVSQNAFQRYFNFKIVALAFLSLFTIFVLARILGRLFKLKNGRLASFMQSSFHSNIGYLALAVAYYYLDDEGFAHAGIFAGFVMIFQNFLAVLILNLYAAKGRTAKIRWLPILSKIFGSPVILSSAAGMLFSLTGLSLPLVINRALTILSGLALPTALLIIGATLSFRLLRKNLILVVATSILKLFCMPCMALVLFYYAGIPKIDFLPVFILLSSPTATITYVMAKELNGDPDFAVAAISLNTLLSAFTFTVWMNIPS